MEEFREHRIDASIKIASTYVQSFNGKQLGDKEAAWLKEGEATLNRFKSEKVSAPTEDRE